MNNRKKLSITTTCIVLAIGLMFLKGYMDGNHKASIDKECLETISGSYKIASGEEKNYLSLNIGENEDGDPHFSIYDSEAGNPGVEGKIVFLDDKKIIVESDPDYFEELPSDSWELDSDKLEMTYEHDGEDIVLTNHDVDIKFEAEGKMYTVCGHWHAADSDSLETIEFAEGYVALTGWFYDPSYDGGSWDNVPTSWFRDGNMTFEDQYISHKELTQEEFEKLLQSDKVNNTVIEFDVSEASITAVRLVGNDESKLAE